MVHEFHVTVLHVSVGGIDRCHNRLALGIGIVEIERYVLAYLPIGADIGNRGERSVTIRGSPRKSKHCIVVSSATQIPQIVGRSKLQPMQVGAERETLGGFVD